MRLYLMLVAMLCAMGAGAQQASQTFTFSNPSRPPHTVTVSDISGKVICRRDGDTGELSLSEGKTWKDCVSALMDSVAGKFVPYSAPQQEKAPPALPDNGTCHENIARTEIQCLSPSAQPVPFDIPAKLVKGSSWTDNAGNIWEFMGPHYSCEGVSADWKQRALIETADGKYHCYNLISVCWRRR